MADTTNSDSEESSTDSDKTKSSPNKLQLKACDLEVKAQSNEASFEEISEIASEQMEMLMEHQLVGELEHIEKENLHPTILG
jgi:hypothetical protein